MRLMPNGDHFFETFHQLATRLTQSAGLLAQLFAAPTTMLDKATAIRTIEREADAIAHEVNAHIAKSFVAPLDRDDIHLLVTLLNNAIDIVDDIAQHALIFHIGVPRPAASQLADILLRAARHLEGAVRDIKKRKSAFQQLGVVKQLEEEADSVYQEAVTILFGGDTTDPIEILKWKELYQRLEDATDECQHTARVIENIVMTRA